MNKKKVIPAIVDYTAELEALRRFYNGEEIGNNITIEELLAKIYRKAKPRLEVVKKLHQRHSMEYVPILNDREVCDPMDIDNRLNNDFFSQIINEKASYFSGNPMAFAFEEQDNVAAEKFEEFKTRVRLDDINYETTKNCGIGGYDARLIYLKREIESYENGLPKYRVVEAVKQIPAYEAILLGDSGYDETEFGIRVVEYKDLEGENIVRVELYMPFRALIFEGNTIDDIKRSEKHHNDILLDGEVVREYGVVNYPFSKCPMYGYENNTELLGDAERVINLIDDYDRTTSDTSSELEANRGAYLAFFGVNPPRRNDGFDSNASGVLHSQNSYDEFDSKASGTFYFQNSPDSKQDAKFITKDLPVDAKEAHLKRLERNIYMFSQTPDLTDRMTGNAASGEALKQMLIPMENKTASFERKFTSGNLRMLECLKDWYKLAYNIDFDPYKVHQIYKRKMPTNLDYEADLIEKLKDYFPMETVYSLISFVTNPSELAKWYEEEQRRKERDLYEEVDNESTDGGDATADMELEELSEE